MMTVGNNYIRDAINYFTQTKPNSSLNKVSLQNLFSFQLCIYFVMIPPISIIDFNFVFHLKNNYIFMLSEDGFEKN